MRAAWWLPLIVLAGCDNQTYTIVTVEGRPAVHGIVKLTITLSNADSTESNTVDFGKHTLPATFSVAAPGRTGDLGIHVEATDADDNLAAIGDTTTPIDAPTASLTLEPADFVVNTDVADDQLLSNYSNAHGFQLSSTADGTWTAVYNVNCSAACDLFARRFGTDGLPVETAVSASPNSFPITTRQTTFFTTPAVASTGMFTIAVWNFDEPPPATAAKGISCRTLDAAGNANADQVDVSTDEFPDLISVQPMSNSNFIAAWDGRVGGVDKVRASIIGPDCVPIASVNGTVFDAASTVGTDTPHLSAVATSGDRIMFTWIVNGSVKARVATNSGMFLTGDLPIANASPTEQIDHVRVSQFGDGFAIAVRWGLINFGPGAGRIEIYRTDSGGALQGPPLLVTDRSSSEFVDREAFGIAGGASGPVLVVWHACGDLGDGADCGVFGRFMTPTGPAGNELVLATATQNAQTGPSATRLPDGSFATAWTDRSDLAPDKSGAAVRARIVYPP
jgi:hypothetical protein